MQNVVEYFIPQKAVYCKESDVVKVSVSAVSGGDVSFYFGSREFKATEGNASSAGHSLYTAQIKVPDSKEKIDSVKRIKVVYSSVSIPATTVDGPEVFYDAHAQTTSEETTTKKAAETTAETTSQTAKELTTNITQIANYKSTDADTTSPKYKDETYDGLKMIKITSERADVFPGKNQGDDYNPSKSSLCKGTYAYITGTSSFFDSEKGHSGGETRSFFDLQCGLRVEQKYAELVTENFGDNSVTASATETSKGTCFTFNETWHVPYQVELYPVNYVANNHKKYGIKSFYPTEIRLTFYNTSAASGSFDLSSSKSISHANWSTDSSAKTATLTMTLKKSGAYYGFCAKYDSAGNFIFTLNNKANSLNGAVIVVDPGHGGNDGGAKGYNNIRECDINFAESVLLKQKLEARGATVYFTRYDDVTLSLDERADFVVKYNPDLFVAVHSNYAHVPSAHGPSVYYYKPMSHALANSVYNSLLGAYRTKIYQNEPDRLDGIERGCNYYPFAVTRVDECPAILLELGFVSNETECAKLCDESVRDSLADAITNGISDYLTNY